jgi:glyoxylase-like metal-dependent hydrolase (beta-lactamase superfamily II)
MQLHLILAGEYWTDAGAFMGVLPYSIWHKKVETDERRRLKMHLNLLLIQTPNRNILVDTGLGNRLTDRQKDIYSPSDFLLIHSLHQIGLKPEDITDIIMTHLHFDHAGGVISQIEGNDVLTFPQAVYHIQKAEWEMAKHPDGLNRAAYQFDHQLSLLETKGNIQLTTATTEICSGVYSHWVGGHTIGMQMVEAVIEGKSYIYAGDIIPTRFHQPLAITSAYDVSREQSYAAKLKIYEKLRDTNGFLLFDHDTTQWQIPYNEILF